jgi:hypothetical protein
LAAGAVGLVSGAGDDGALLKTLKLELLPEPLPKTELELPGEPKDDPCVLLLPCVPLGVLEVPVCPIATPHHPRPAATQASQ